MIVSSHRFWKGQTGHIGEKCMRHHQIRELHDFPDFSIYWKSQTSYRNANNHRQIESTPFTMVMFALDGTSFSNCRLEFGNGAYNYKIEYDSDLKVRIFNDLVSYEMQKNDYNTGTQLNLSNSNSLYPLKYFDFSFRVEKVTRDPKQLIFSVTWKNISSDYW